MQMKNLSNFARALRLPFITASVLPFIFASLIVKQRFNFLYFSLGLISVIATHLSANLINDYADSKSGADWQDRHFWSFFGGSKLIQEKVFSERFYLYSAICFALLAISGILLLSVFLKNFLIIGLYFVIILLSWSYSAKPMQFCYHKWGEVIIFLLFGPAVVMGAYFIQTGIFPDLRSFFLSLPFGFLTTAILFANEVPDFSDDLAVKKFTWVTSIGRQKAFLIYAALLLSAFLSIALTVVLKYLNPLALISLLFIPLAVNATNVLRICFRDKVNLVESSQLTILIHTVVSIILILTLII